MRVLVIAAAVVLGTISLAPTASAYCDPKYRPLCMNDCNSEPPDLKDPLGNLFRTCPD